MRRTNRIVMRFSVIGRSYDRSAPVVQSAIEGSDLDGRFFDPVDPGRNRTQFTIEANEVRKIAGSYGAMFVAAAQEGGRHSACHGKSILLGHAEQPNCVADRARHVEMRSGERSGRIDALAVGY